MHEAAATRCKCGRETAARCEATFEALNISASLGQPALLANDETLRLAPTPELSHQQFGLPLPAAVSAGEIDVANRLQPRNHNAARPVMLIVIVYGTAMITMRP